MPKKDSYQTPEHVHPRLKGLRRNRDRWRQGDEGFYTTKDISLMRTIRECHRSSKKFHTEGRPRKGQDLGWAGVVVNYIKRMKRKVANQSLQHLFIPFKYRSIMPSITCSLLYFLKNVKELQSLYTYG